MVHLLTTHIPRSAKKLAEVDGQPKTGCGLPVEPPDFERAARPGPVRPASAVGAEGDFRRLHGAQVEIVV